MSILTSLMTCYICWHQHESEISLTLVRNFQYMESVHRGSPFHAFITKYLNGPFVKKKIYKLTSYIIIFLHIVYVSYTKCLHFVNNQNDVCDEIYKNETASLAPGQRQNQCKWVIKLYTYLYTMMYSSYYLYSKLGKLLYFCIYI